MGQGMNEARTIQGIITQVGIHTQDTTYVQQQYHAALGYSLLLGNLSL